MGRKIGVVFGVGFNDCEYTVFCSKERGGERCPYYARWVEMLRRCYSCSFHKKRPTYIGCTVCDDWLTFSNFKAWMEKQDWEGKQLDKDLLLAGNKVYSPDNCVFVDAVINNFTTDRKLHRGECLLGVDVNNGMFRAQCRNFMSKKREFLGYYKSQEEAHLAWKARKHELALQLAESQSDERIANALRSRYL